MNRTASSLAAAALVAVAMGAAAMTAKAPEPAPRAAAAAAAATTDFLPGDILNNASFETGWDGMRDGGRGEPSGVTRSTAQHFGEGRYAVQKVLVAHAPSDTPSQFHYAFYNRDGQNGYVHTGHGVDRLYSRFWFKVDQTFNGTILKLQMFQADGFNKFSEFGFFRNYLTFNFQPEWQGGVIRIASLASLNDDRWHSLESDYQLNGNTDAGGDYASVAIWLDGVDVSVAAPRPVGGQGNVRLGRWINGRINAGSRAPRNAGKKIGVWSGPNILNARNPVAGNLWVDNISISTRGRVGPGTR